MVKILKQLTDNHTTSYHCKFARNDSLFGRTRFRDKDIIEDDIGAALMEVIKHRTVRGKFLSVHPDLRATGVSRLEIGEHGITFHRGDFSLEKSIAGYNY